MKSPFPGMDPYLENYWGDVHTSLMVYASNQINAQLPDELQARVQEGLGVEIEDEAWHTVYPMSASSRNGAHGPARAIRRRR